MLEIKNLTVSYGAITALLGVEEVHLVWDRVRRLAARIPRKSS